MTSRTRLGIAVGLFVLVGLIAVVAVGSSRGSVRGYVGDNYQLVRATSGTANGEYKSTKTPSVVADEIAGRWKPAQRHLDPSGHFLRYRDTMVVVAAAAAGGGSQIHVDDERRGYARWYPYIGGYWGTFSGSGEGFRGGGPGAGK